MLANLYGYRRVDMKDEQSGRDIRGWSCFVGFVSVGVEGEETAKVFVSEDMAADTGFYPYVGKSVNLEYGPRGKLVSISNDE